MTRWNWEKISGPGRAFSLNFFAPKFDFSVTAKGTYEFKATASNPSKLNIQMFTGLTLSGPPGNYVIEATTNLNPAVWIPMTNISLNAASSQWVDLDSPNYPHRFYRAVPQP